MRLLAIQPIASPFGHAFDSFIDAVDNDCLICSPYITMGPVKRLIKTIEQRAIQDSLRAQVVTDMSAGNLVSGSTDLNALLFIAEHLSRATIVHLPRVHAKVYVSGRSLAIVASANFTDGGMYQNLEYGLSTSDPALVRSIRRDLEEYAALGAQVPYPELLAIRDRVESVRGAIREEERSIDRKLHRLSQDLFRRAEDELLKVRVKGRTVNAIFSDTIRFLLARGPMRTVDLHRQVQRLHPDLCDDTTDRVINGEHFGKLWKHQVRNAQSHLKRVGMIAYDPTQRTWTLRGGPEMPSAVSS